MCHSLPLFDGEMGEQDGGFLVPQHTQRYAVKQKTAVVPRILAAEWKGALYDQ
jgi:hypothetical protein